MIMIVACQPKKVSSVVQTNMQGIIPVCMKAPSVEAAYLSNLPDPVLRSRNGNSRMKVSTDRPEAQRRFDQGLNLLHGFMYFDAYRAFVSGSTCASGMLMIQYEGMFMLAPVHVRFSEWQQAADYLSSCVSDNANAMLFRDGLLAYCLAMEKLLQPQPPPILT